MGYSDKDIQVKIELIWEASQTEYTQVNICKVLSQLKCFRCHHAGEKGPRKTAITFILYFVKATLIPLIVSSAFG